MRSRAVITSAATLGILACSGGTTMMGSSDVLAFQEATAAVRAAVNEHCNSAAPIVVPSACNEEEARYEAKVRPLVARMMDASGRMDDCMRGLEQGSQADMGAMCKSMQDELDRHAAAACVGNATQFRDEAERNCSAMLHWADQEDQRSGSLREMMGHGMRWRGECHP